MCCNLQKTISSAPSPPSFSTTTSIICDPPILSFLSFTSLLATEGDIKLLRLPQDHTSRVSRFWKDTEHGAKFIKLSQFHTSRLSRLCKSRPGLEFSFHKWVSPGRSRNHISLTVQASWLDFPRHVLQFGISL